MILYLLGCSRQLKRCALVLSFLFSALTVASADPLAAPTVLTAGGQCPDTVVTWSASGPVRYYMVILTGPSGSAQLAFEQQATFSDLQPGSYSVTVKAVSASPDSSDSDFSPAFSLSVGRCGGCDVPQVVVNTASPSTLWPPNGHYVP